MTEADIERAAGEIGTAMGRILAASFPDVEDQDVARIVMSRIDYAIGECGKIGAQGEFAKGFKSTFKFRYEEPNPFEG